MTDILQISLNAFAWMKIIQALIEVDLDVSLGVLIDHMCIILYIFSCFCNDNLLLNGKQIR